MGKYTSEFCKRTLFAERLRQLEAKKSLYASLGEASDVYKYQLRRVNELWDSATKCVPFYRYWKERHGLPDSIPSISALSQFPVLTKHDIIRNQDLVLEGLTDYWLISTGGTSGATTHFPTSKVDVPNSYAKAYVGRSWWGIQPFDRILMFWGHSHLFGSGLKRYIRQFKRKAADYVINTKRVSSYDLGARNIARFLSHIMTSQPDAIISYTSNMYKICKYMESKDLTYNAKNLKGIILTSETATDADVALISKRLNAPVILEYGMAETGVIGYSRYETRNIRILWDSFIITANEEGRLHLTTIGEKIFPLINYDSEDSIVTGDVHEKSVLSLSFINGKQRDVLAVPSHHHGTVTVSSIFLDHVLKCYPHIYSMHYEQENDGVNVLLTSERTLDLADVRSYFVKEASRDFPDLDFAKISFQQIDKELKTVAGKSRAVL